VERGDTLIGIARNILNDPGRWTEIYQLNADRISNPNLLAPGTELRLPPE
jgi:nucleoid-associated protein YgaU